MSVNTLSDALAKALNDADNPAQYSSAATRVYAGLRDQIISLALPPDSVLSRDDIAESFSVSQSPVREALQRLEGEGLVVSFPKSKTLVTKIDTAHARETQFMRVGIELEVVKTLAKAKDDELLAPAARVLRMQKLAGEDGDIAEFNTLDRLFHLSLFQSANVPALWHQISLRSGHIDRLRRLNLPDPGKMAQVIQDHGEILDAIRNKKAGEAEKLTRKHLSGTLQALDEIRTANPQFFE